MVILVTGGRDFNNVELIRTVLHSFNIGEVLVGDCPTGVDKWVRDWTTDYGIPCQVYKADWEREGKKAGPLRNQWMVDEEPDICLVFPGGRGTSDCANRAKKAGIPVLRVEI